MRVIAGSLKGRRLKTPWWDGLRPTSDKLRETLFNILAPRIAGARVLDGYAGTGALGIEAFSRGAAWVTLIDDDRRAQMLIAENLARCGIENSYAIIRAKVARALDSLHNQPAFEPFEIVLLDPPYALRSILEAGFSNRGRRPGSGPHGSRARARADRRPGARARAAGSGAGNGRSAEALAHGGVR